MCIRDSLYRFLDSEIDKGRQVYLVCPAIEDVPDGGLNAVKTYYCLLYTSRCV